ncbi:MAG TPA: hypothetical protein VGI92_10465 [Gemmatimonadales bacterium]
MTNTFFLKRTAGLIAVLALASCFGDSTGPGPVRQGRFSIAPVMDKRAAAIVTFDSVHVHLVRPADSSVALDTTVFFPANLDTLTLNLVVTVQGVNEQFALTMDLINGSTHSIVFHSGPTTITASTTGQGTTATPVLTYVGTGSHAAGVRFLGPTPSTAFFQDTITYVAEAFDSQGVTIPNTPIYWTSSDSTRVRVLNKAAGTVIAGIQRGNVTITAALLTPPPPVTRPLLVQPKPTALVIQGGNGQTAGVGSPLAQPLVARVNGSDGLGVQGIPVTFAVTSGGGSLSKLVDTTDANGDAHTAWTMGTGAGAQGASATAASLAPATVGFTGTATAGALAKLGYAQQPTNAQAAASIAPAVKVSGLDNFGNIVTTFTGNVVLALGANPGGSTLSGTLTVAAVNGVATFGNLSLNNQGIGYTVIATSGALAPDTSALFNIAGAGPKQLFITQQPSSANPGQVITPAITVAIQDTFGNLVSSATNTVTAAILNNAGGGTLSGTLSVAAVNGIATFSNLSINNAGTGYTLNFTSSGLVGATSSAFNIGSGAASTLKFGTQPPAAANFQTPFGFTVAATDAVGSVVTGFSGNITVALGSNPASGTLSGTATATAVNGVATFSGISIDNIGAGYTLSASASGLSNGTSGTFNVVAPAGVNAWINTAGGNWGLASNWSKGAVPVATDTVAIAQSGTYTVTMDVNASPVALGVGAPIGTQTLVVPGNTLTLSTSNVFTTHGKLSFSGGTIVGTGALTLLGGFDWTGGDLAMTGAITIPSGATTISGSGTPQAWVRTAISVGGAATWTGTPTYNSGIGASLTILSGGTLDVRGDPVVNVNQGGTTSLNILTGASMTRSTSTLPFNFGGVVNNAGSISVTSGILALAGGGGSTGSYNVAAGTRLDFGGGTQALAGPVSSAGQITVSAGTVNATSNWSGTGSLVVQGGNMAVLGPVMSIDTLQETSGSIGGSVGGVMAVNKSFSWTGGNFAGSGGGSGAIIQVTSAASGTINLAATAAFTNMTLDLSGPTQWLGAGAVNSGLGATIIVEAAGTLNLQSNFNLQNNQGGTTLIHNLGTITRTVGVGTADLQVQVDNDAQITASSGTLRLDGGSAGANTADGVYTATSPGTIEFFGGVHSLGSAGTINGNGSILIDGGAVNDAGAMAQTGTTTISGGGFDYNGSNATIPSLLLSGGTLGGSGLITVLNGFTWANGNIQGSGGTLHMNASATATINPGTSATFTNFVVELAGPSSWSGTQTINTGLGAILRVQNGGTLAIQGDPQLLQNQGGAVTQLQVQTGGLLTRTTSVNPAIINVQTDNDGQIIVTSGTLRLSNGTGAGQSDGAYTSTAPGTIDFNNGTHTLSNLGTLTGTGTMLVSGGVVNASGTWSVTGATQVSGGFYNYQGAGTGTSSSLSVSGGAFGGTGLFTVSGATTWSGGDISGGSGTLRSLSGGTLAITTATARNFASHTLEIGGTGTWTGGFVLSSGQSAVMRVLPTGSLALSASADLSLNLGGVSTFDNQGTFTSSAPTANWTAFYQDTVGTTSITSGNFNVNGGARLGTGTGKSIAAGATFGQTLGSVTFKQGTTFSGAGKYVVAGGQMNPDSNTATGALTLTNFDLNGGQLLNEGLLTISGTMNWNGGNITSNNNGLGGTTRILASGNLNILTTAVRTLAGTHLLEMDGTNNTWSGAAAPTINTGLGAIIRVQSGATFNVTNTNPTISLNQGGTATFDNLGTVNRSTGTAGFVVNVPVTGNGAWNISGTGNLDVQCGGGANTCNFTGATTVGTGTQLLQNGGVITYTAASSITGAGAIQLNSGTFNSQGPMTIGSLTITGTGSLAMGGNTISVTGNFATLASGTFSQTSATNNDSLNVAGNVSFGGGLGTTNAGVIRTTGSFSQTGAANFKGTAQSATVAHRVRLEGNSTSVGFADPVNSFFRRLLIARNAGQTLTLNTDVKTTFFSMLGGTYSIHGIASPMSHLIADTVAGASSGSVSMQSPMVLVANVANIIDSNVINVDTVVFAGSGQTIIDSAPGGTQHYIFQSIRAAQSAGAASFGKAVTLTKDLEVSSGTLNLAGFHIAVPGNFRTTGTGTLTMHNAADSLGVGGNATFAGNSTTGLLTAGLLDLKGNFSQVGFASPASFAPSTAYRTRFDLPGSAVIQTVSFASPTTSFFDSLITDRSVGTRGTVQFLTDATINRGWSLQNSTDITGATAHVTVNAPGVFHALVSTTSPTLQLSSLAFGALPSVGFLPGVGINPDTTVYNVAGLIQLTGFTFKSFRAANAVVLAASSTLTLAADLIADGAAGQFSPQGSSVTNVGGRLVTSNGGKLSMVNASDLVKVAGNATFAGGSSTLSGGTLRLAGNFTEGGGSTSAFQAAAAFNIEFNNTTRRTVSMPDFGTGATNSRFGQVHLFGSPGPVSINLLTSIQAAEIGDTSLLIADTVSGSAGIAVTADSTGFVSLSNTIFNGATLTLSSGAATQSLSTIQFRNMDPTSTFLTMFRNAAAQVTINGMNFNSAHTSGHYFSANTVGAGAPGTFTFPAGSLPASFTAGAADYTRTGATLPTVNWNGVTNP